MLQCKLFSDQSALFYRKSGKPWGWVVIVSMGPSSSICRVLYALWASYLVMFSMVTSFLSVDFKRADESLESRKSHSVTEYKKLRL